MSNDYFNPPNSVWPNGLKRDEEGYVTFYPTGTNKVDISTITWPEGDKLVSPFVYQNNELVGFVDAKALTVSGSATTTMNYNHIEADFASISEGKLTVNAPNATIKKFSWSVIESGDDNVIVTVKYKGCKKVDDVKAVDPNYLTNDIVDGVWSEGLGDLTNGVEMFRYCTNLNSFSSDLSKLTNGGNMFNYCTNLTSFSSDLPSLTDGSYMFSKCKLNAPSVKNIIDTINSSSKLLTLGIGCDNTTKDKNLFAQEVGYDNITSLLAALKAKGWTVTAQYNGRPTTTYGLRRPSENTLPVFIKLEEDEKHADYTSEDGSKKFRLNWFHETTGSTEGYTQFNSLEEAVAHFNIKPIERN